MDSKNMPKGLDNFNKRVVQGCLRFLVISWNKIKLNTRLLLDKVLIVCGLKYFFLFNSLIYLENQNYLWNSNEILIQKHFFNSQLIYSWFKSKSLFLF